MRVIDFKQAKKRIEAKRIAAVEEELKQQAWYKNAINQHKRKQDFIFILMVSDIILGIIFFML